MGESIQTSEVVSVEYVWRIGQMSWLHDTLEHCTEDYLASEHIERGESSLQFEYNPDGGDNGTLAIYHFDSPDGLTFRYKIFVRQKGGEFRLWGAGHKCDGEDGTYFGPDVPGDGGATPQGIFGLSHKALCESEWVQDDTLTVRFELELRAPIPYKRSVAIPDRVEIPSASITSDLLSLLDTGKCSDALIVVEQEAIKVHSPILCSRSEVFDKFFNGGMRESVTKTIHIEDCSASTFKAVVRFLYSDDLNCMEAALTSALNGNGQAATRATWLQAALAVSHKYALLRLQAWCEQKLCDCITLDDVCPMLCQAHLHEAKQLAIACLKFIQKNHGAVVATEAFGTLARDWPEVLVKINAYIAGVTEDTARSAVGASQRKRKRDE